jgi:DNA-binding CsgD family transcriptional regulator
VDEIARIHALLQRGASTAGPRVALVEGEPGIGKTRLLAEATRRLSTVPVRRLTGFEPEQTVPFAAAASLLAGLSAAEGAGARLRSLLAAGPGDRDLDPLRVLEAASQAMLAMGPVLLVIDDLQWLDDLSRAFAHHLVRAALGEGAALSLLCASRPAPTYAAFSRSLRELLDPRDIDEIRLEPLGRTEGITLAQVVHAGLSPERAEQIWNAGHGSPFWIELAAVRGLNPGGPLPAVPAMLGALTDDANACLGAVSVVARPVRVEVLSGMLDWPTGRVRHAVDELVTGGLVAVRASLVDTTHDIVREAAAAYLPQSEVTRLHGRIAAYLQEHAGGDIGILMEALVHADAAGAIPPKLALEIARSPHRRLLADQSYERLVDCATAAGLDPQDRLTLTVELADMAAERGDLEAAQAWQTWLSTVLPAAADRAAAAIATARHAMELSRAADVADATERARRYAGADQWTNVAADAYDHDRLVWLEFDQGAAKPYLERAVTTARRLVTQAGGLDVLPSHAREAYALALDAERISYLMADRIDESLVAAEQVAEATRGMGERHLEARLNVIVMTRFTNRWPAVARQAGETLREAQQAVYPRLVADAADQVALASYNVGRVADAWEQFAWARTLHERAGTADLEPMDTALGSLGELIEASARDWRSALTALVEKAQVYESPHCRLVVHQGAALVGARFAPQDNADVVREHLALADADAHAAGCPRCLAELEAVAVGLVARIGDVARAVELLRAFDAAHPQPNPRIRFFRDQAAALVAWHAGEPTAVDLLRAVAEAAGAAGTRLEQVWGLLDLGVALLASDPSAAAEVWTQAEDLAADLGAASERALAAAHLRGVGIRHAAGGRRSADGDSPLAALSRRELEVARLAASGARNAEIAESLFIASKTVEQHLSRIFAKLGVRNRAALGDRFGSELRAATVTPHA